MPKQNLMLIQFEVFIWTYGWFLTSQSCIYLICQIIKRRDFLDKLDIELQKDKTLKTIAIQKEP